MYNPDIIVLGRSRLGFIAKDAKRHLGNIKIICVVDNVEYDYVDSYFASNNSLPAKIKKCIEKRVVFRDEKNSALFCDKLIYISMRNVRRFEELYSHKDTNPCIIPISLSEDVHLTLNSTFKTVFFIGSLDYEANKLAVELLLKIWDDSFSSESGFRLIIAGRKPDGALINRVKKYKNIDLYPDFSSVEMIIPRFSLMIAPITVGAGMKTKVAEGLSMGVPIAASAEALVGYENSMYLDGVRLCQEETDYINTIKWFCSLPKTELERIEIDNKKCFYKYYSFDSSNSLIEDLMKSMK